MKSLEQLNALLDRERHNRNTAALIALSEAVFQHYLFNRRVEGYRMLAKCPRERVTS